MKLLLAGAALLFATSAFAEQGDTPEIEAQFFGYDIAAHASQACGHVSLATDWIIREEEFKRFNSATADPALKLRYMRGFVEFSDKFERNGKAACAAAGASAAFQSIFYK
jgi:hypothetical protein